MIASALPFALAVAAVAHPQDVSIGWREGELLPDLELPTIDGAETHRLSDFRGKKLLLVQFASW